MIRNVKATGTTGANAEHAKHRDDVLLAFDSALVADRPLPAPKPPALSRLGLATRFVFILFALLMVLLFLLAAIDPQQDWM